jgi:hypothetical protein
LERDNHGQPNNRAHVNAPELNAMLIAQRRELALAKRTRIVHDIQRDLAAKAYYGDSPIGLSNHIHQPHLKGFLPRSGIPWSIR